MRNHKDQRKKKGKKTSSFLFLFLRAPRRPHRPRGARRQPPGGPGPPALRPRQPGPTHRRRVSAALRSTQRPPGGRGVPRGEGRRRGRPERPRPGSSAIAAGHGAASATLTVLR